MGDPVEIGGHGEESVAFTEEFGDVMVEMSEEFAELTKEMVAKMAELSAERGDEMADVLVAMWEFGPALAPDVRGYGGNCGDDGDRGLTE
jgi:hypothetical protein